MSTIDDYFDECLCFVSNKLVRTITDLAEKSFRGTGLSSSHAFLMLVILDCPGITPNEAAKKMDLAPSTITRFLDKLEHKKLITRTIDRKHVHIHPTSEGKKLKKSLDDAWSNLDKRFGQSITPEDYAAAVKVFNSVYRSLKNSENK
ncbi:MAG TPA: MarR family transcriptional regulator [Spirochaetota bacterium]